MRGARYGSVFGSSWGDELGRRTARELCPLAAEVRLIEVLAFERKLGPSRRLRRRLKRESLLKSAHPGIALWRHPYIFHEDLDEPAPAEAETLGDFTDFESRALQLMKRSLHGTSCAATAGQMLHERTLQNVETRA